MNASTLQLLLQLAVVTPLAGGLILAFGNFLPKRLCKLVAFVGFLVPLLVALHLWWAYSDAPKSDGYAFLSSVDLGLSALLGISLKLGLNGISLPLFVLAAIVGFAAGLVALNSGAERLKLYLMLLLVMHGGLMGVFASVDVFFFYFFHEFALIPTFIMVGVWGGRDRTYAAMKMTIYLTAGAMLSLAGLIAIYTKSNAASFDLIALRAALADAGGLLPVLQNYFFGLLLFGFGILVSLWPFHTWAPLGYGAAPTSVSMLHAGVLKKFGLYGLVQIALPLLPLGARDWAPWLIWLALANVVVIGLVTLAQRDLKQMIGFGSVMHVGYGFLGVACLSTLGAGGAVLFMVAHGLSVALLFLLGQEVLVRTGTFDMTQMGGLVKRAPVLAGFFSAAMLASIGLPGFAGFWGELTVFLALWNVSHLYAALAMLGLILSAVYGLRAVAKIFFGQPTELHVKYAEANPTADLSWSARIPALVLFAALFFLGFWPKALTAPLNETLGTIYPALEAAVKVAAAQQ